MILCFAGIGFMAYRRKNAMALNATYDHRMTSEGRFRAVFLFSVPDLTRKAGIQLNERVSLQRPIEILSSI
jgi:hypothetical protein